MRMLRWMLSVLGLMALAGCGGGGSATSGRSAHYKLTDLGRLPGSSATKALAALRLAPLDGTVTRAAGSRSTTTDLGNALVFLHGLAVNSAGQVVTTAGNVFDPNTQAQAVLFQAGKTQGLGTLGGSASYGFDVNANGQAVGFSGLSGDAAYHAFLYTQSKMTDLGTLGGQNSIAYALNNAGQVVGISDTQMPPADASPLPDPSTRHVFLYQNGQMQDLGAAMDGYTVTPYAINDGGQIIGQADGVLVPTSLLAFTYNKGAFSTLPSLGGSWSGAFAINNDGVIVGQSSTTGKPGDPDFRLHAVTWKDGKVTDLGTLPNGDHSIAFGINSNGDIVGGSTAAQNSLYDLGFVQLHGQAMQDLNTLIPANSGWMLLSAQSISDQGQIVGIGRINNELHAYLLTP